MTPLSSCALRGYSIIYAVRCTCNAVVVSSTHVSSRSLPRCTLSSKATSIAVRSACNAVVISSTHVSSRALTRCTLTSNGTRVTISSTSCKIFIYFYINNLKNNMIYYKQLWEVVYKHFKLTQICIYESPG